MRSRSELIFNYVPHYAGSRVELLTGEKDTSEEREHIAGAKKIQRVYADGAINAEVRTPGKTLHGFCEQEYNEVILPARQN